MVTFPTAQAIQGHVVSALGVEKQPGIWDFMSNAVFIRTAVWLAWGDRIEQEVGAFLDDLKYAVTDR